MARGTGDSDVRELLAEHPDPEPDESEWNQEYRLNLFHWAAKRVQVEFREATWQAFWRTVVQQERIETVAREIGISPGAIYVARSRVTARIRQEIQAVEGEAA